MSRHARAPALTVASFQPLALVASNPRPFVLEFYCVQEDSDSQPNTSHPARAMNALAWAVERAERGITEPVQFAEPDDFRAAAVQYLPDVRRAFDRIIMAYDAELGLDALLECGALKAVLPEVKALVGFGDGEWRHKDVWKHTKQVVRQAVPLIEVRWAALLHDIGKVKTRTITPDGEVHFFGHAEVGARMFDRLDRRLPLFAPEPALKTSVRFLILHHLRASQYDSSWSDSAVRRFAREMGDCLDNLFALSRADITTKRAEKKKKGLRQISELADRVEKLREIDAKVPPLPSGIGDDIMKAFGIPPSRKIGEIKKALEAAVDSGEVPSHESSEFYVSYLRENAARFLGGT